MHAEILLEKEEKLSANIRLFCVFANSYRKAPLKCPHRS
jgi:hypothetical protein